MCRKVMWVFNTFDFPSFCGCDIIYSKNANFMLCMFIHCSQVDMLEVTFLLHVNQRNLKDWFRKALTMRVFWQIQKMVSNIYNNNCEYRYIY